MGGGSRVPSGVVVRGRERSAGRPWGNATKGVAIVLTGQSRKVLDRNQEISSPRLADTVLVSAVPAESLDGARLAVRYQRSFTLTLLLVRADGYKQCGTARWAPGNCVLPEVLLWQFSLTSTTSGRHNGYNVMAVQRN
ncbi:hypothetical protein COCVIDRAFT_108410 [Bipolaris victoriae FI3]|uniref:Uncharacterized protein n=2 Tax=Bipolaris TaxID=33194 RepID=W6YIM3_COCC2|nr:uncharacterized protein COCCADRAFT_90758 [Bipolaris zeicola 26-R-13]XP_014553154.1 hypothetical protein COCVIDRAFT_108410 [Bipolaris victoriae FI3]EUC35484.1 hypothetical protein COCCADRAFT_90758 [Bipolaris zeicola 26-R-13]